LLAAMLIASDDDAADALALADSGSLAAFSNQMNSIPPRWGIDHTHFSNASGLTDKANYASARSLAQLASLLIQNPTAQRLVASPAATITDAAGQSYSLKSTDDLLQSGAFTGIKTGYTPAAGQCFVGLATTPDNHQVITVVLGSGDRFGDTQKLLTWIEDNYTWQ
jgi:D-alanyl-D-alanine carboxypeptidase (penicillin-binding protein 5/6)